MVIFDENTETLLIDNLNSPIVNTHFWVLDLEEKDFKLTKLEVLEEHETPMLVLSIGGYAIEVPADWNLLLISPETNQIDVAEISEVTRGHFHAFVYNHKKDKVIAAPVKIIHYSPKHVLHTPSISKNQMLSIAVGENCWICISPIDNYNKYLKGAIANDLVY